MEFLNALVNFFNSDLFRFIVSLTKIFFVVFWLSLVYWTYRDAKSRGAMPFYWATVVLLFFIFGWFVYMVIRPPELADEVKERELEIKAKEALLSQSELVCPACLRPVERDFLICPHCLKKLKKSCPSCRHALKLGWTICPYCQHNL
jgi:RNA polymerase subunit RPABC4/transcription elongation factor Spt4